MQELWLLVSVVSTSNALNYLDFSSLFLYLEINLSKYIGKKTLQD